MTELDISAEESGSIPLLDMVEGTPVNIDDYVFIEMVRRTAGIIPNFIISLIGVIIYSKIQGLPSQFILSVTGIVVVLIIRLFVALISQKNYHLNSEYYQLLHSSAAYLTGLSLGVVAVFSLVWLRSNNIEVMVLFVLFTAAFGSALTMSLNTLMLFWFNLFLLMPVFFYFLLTGFKGLMICVAIGFVFGTVLIVSKKHKQWFMNNIHRTMEFRLNYQQLEQIIREKTSEQRRLEKELMETGERERQKIGSDLHDDLGQHLVGIEAICSMLYKRLRHSERQESQLVETIHKLMKEAISKTRRIAKGLCPVDLEENGLLPALEELAQTVEVAWNIPCNLKRVGRPPRINHYQSVNIYHIIQEALNNAARHSGATHISISSIVKGSCAVFIIEDNGTGNLYNNHNRGLGLRILRYRAGLIGADIDIISNPGAGTKIQCKLNGIY